MRKVEVIKNVISGEGRCSESYCNFVYICVNSAILTIPGQMVL